MGSLITLRHGHFNFIWHTRDDLILHIFMNASFKNVQNLLCNYLKNRISFFCTKLYGTRNSEDYFGEANVRFFQHYLIYIDSLILPFLNMIFPTAHCIISLSSCDGKFRSIVTRLSEVNERIINFMWTILARNDGLF